MVAAQPIVKFSHATKRYGDGPVVLSDLNLEVTPGEFISLIGPSGCGKSTVLKLVSGLSPLSEGELSVAGTTPRAARDRQAFIFQDATLLPWLTARKNVELPMRLRGQPEAARVKKAEELLEWVRLGHAVDYYPLQLSGGMKMRVSIARALSLSPSLLLLDEPFGALDEMTRHHLNEELLALRDRSPFTALFVTHSVEEAVFLSNRVLVMAANPGRVQAEIAVGFGQARDRGLRARPEFHAKVDEVTKRLHEAEDAA
jgi:NitT/TauT family transport system ATP-binding protein